MYFDRFDIVEAYYIFFANWHSGQGSEFYKRLCKMNNYFFPRCFASKEDLSENGQEIYAALLNRFGLKED